MTDLLTFIEATKGTSLKIEVTSKDLLEFADALVERAAAKARGYNLTHRSRKIEEEDFYRFDYIIVMDDMNYESVSRLAPERKYLEKVYRFVEFCSKHPEWSYVPDPYYEGREGFELVLDLLEDGCEGVMQRVKSDMNE